MPFTATAHPKGDGGKGTAAINPAGCLACKGPKVMQVHLRDMLRRPRPGVTSRNGGSCRTG